MKYQAVLFDLDGTLLPMDESEFVKALYSVLVPYVTPEGYSQKEIAQMLRQSLMHVIGNDGTRTNRQAFVDFYDDYSAKNGCDLDADGIEEFYVQMFDNYVQDSCGYDPAASQVISYIKDCGIPIVLATNPFFPQIATAKRIAWAGLDPADFAEITTYEHYHFCKPNLHYYREVFDKTGLQPDRCLMVGNNVAEDMIAKQLGCEVYLITRNLINPQNEDITQYHHGSLEDLLAYLKNQA